MHTKFKYHFSLVKDSSFQMLPPQKGILCLPFKKKKIQALFLE